MPSSVTWRYDQHTERWLRALSIVAGAAVFGVYGGVLVLLVVSLVLALRYGTTAIRLLVVLFVLVGGPLSLLYLAPMLRDPDQRPRFYPRSRPLPFEWRESLALGAVGAIVLGAALLIDPLLAGGLFVLGLCCGVIVSVCSTRGTLDQEQATLTGGARTWDLSRVEDYTVRRVGGLAVLTFDADGPGRFGTVPSWLVVPHDTVPAMTDTLDSVIDRSDAERDRREPNPAVRAVALVFTVLSIVGAGAMFALGGVIGTYAGIIGLLFGVIFLVVAREG